MRNGRFFWKIFLGNAALMILVISTCVWLILGQFDRMHAEEVATYLRTQAQLLRIATQQAFQDADATRLGELASEFGRGEDPQARLTFIRPDGLVLGDSAADPAAMDNHAGRPEIAQAMREGAGQSTRWSHTVNQEMQYVAVRVGPAEAPLGVVRVSYPVRSMGVRAAAERKLIWSVALIVAVGAILLALGLAQLWSRRISHINAAARSLSRRDLNARIRVSGSDEVADLAKSLNQMRDHIAEQLAIIERQHRTFRSLVAQLHEGVVVANRAGRIVLVNPEAVRLLHMTSPRPDNTFEGLPLELCVPMLELQQLLRPSLNGGPRRAGFVPSATRDDAGRAADELLPVSGRPEFARELGQPEQTVELKLQLGGSEGSVSLLARAFDVVLPDPPNAPASENGNELGRLLVLTDVTKLAQTMQMKADFAANASHELRTPLSAIRVAVETIRSLGSDSEQGPFNHFIDVIDRQSGRMEAMVADLLDLSRVEMPTAHFQPSRVRTQELFDELRATFADVLIEKSLEWQVEIDDHSRQITVSAELMRIVLRNLVDNAARFTPVGGRIALRARSLDDHSTVEVADTGCGIPLAEQGRVFERFYQVGRARSGPNRGTGLGLSIVRHAVAAMQGSVRLESEVGKGTRVVVSVPRRAAASLR